MTTLLNINKNKIKERQHLVLQGYEQTESCALRYIIELNLHIPHDSASIPGYQQKCAHMFTNTYVQECS